MPYTLSYNERGYIQFLYEGEANLKDLDAVIEAGVALAREKNCFRVLSDFRSMSLRLSLADIYSIPEIQFKLSRALHTPFTSFRRAMVVPQEQLGDYKFFEDVAVNRAHQIKIFVDMDEAQAWLFEA